MELYRQTLAELRKFAQGLDSYRKDFGEQDIILFCGQFIRSPKSLQ